MGQTDKIGQISDILRKKYGEPKRVEDCDPVEMLVETILSQNTNDKNRDRAFKKLKSKYKNYKEIVDTSQDELAATIKQAGLNNTKAERIQKSLIKIKEKSGEFDLDFLKEMETKKAMDWLQKLPGVGPKTAAIVLNFCFSKPVMAVDTHIYRVSKRLRLVPDSSTRKKAQTILNNKVNDSSKFELHLNIISHGRQTCSARNPDCKACVLGKLCPSREKFLNQEE